jgi:hypothetical protein
MRATLLVGTSVVLLSVACGRKQGPSARAPGDAGAGSASGSGSGSAVAGSGSGSGSASAPVAPGPPAAAARLALGGWRSCAVLTDGTVRCWGVNPSGLSIAGEPRDESATPTAIPGLHDVIDVAV